jgi:hypothetical protein
MGLLLVAMGVAMAGYLFVRIGQVLLDPRSFENQVDRWEFVVRGRTTDAFPDNYETPERRVISAPQAPAEPDSVDPESPNALTERGDPMEETLHLVGRLGSKSARPAALFILILVLLILVKIIVSVIHAGIRLAALSAGDREYMKRIVDELVYQRNDRS